MKYEDVAKLANGLYLVEWLDPDTGLPEPDETVRVSAAAVGRDDAGRVWLAPTNWVTVPWFDWTDVRRVKLVATQRDWARAAPEWAGGG